MIQFLAALIGERRVAAATVGALAIIGGAVAPWARIASPLKPITELGLDADGKLTILCGVAALAMIVAYTFLRQRDLAFGAAVFAAAAIGLQTAYAINLHRASGRAVARILQVAPAAVKAGFSVKTGPGIWLGLAGGTLAVGAMLSLALRAGHEQPVIEESLKPRRRARGKTTTERA